MTQEQLKKLPKIELHCHLDGSLTQECIEELAGKKVSLEDLQAADNCDSLKTYLEKFDLPISVIQTAEGLKKAAFDVIRTAAEENVRYMEIRFAPLFSVNEQLTCEEVLEAVIEGLKQGYEAFHVRAQVIACAMRHQSVEVNKEMFHIARKYLGKGLCAVDLAGDEAAFPMYGFMELFEEAAKLELPYTIHAGECGSVENVINAVKCGAKRIGHGIALTGHESEKALCKEKRIGLEMCPISNLQTKAVPNKDEYPIREFLNDGLLVTINTDNRTVSNTSLIRELSWIQEQYGVTDEEILQIQKNAIEVSFAPKEWKEELKNVIQLT